MSNPPLNLPPFGSPPIGPAGSGPARADGLPTAPTWADRAATGPYDVPGAGGPVLPWLDPDGSRWLAQERNRGATPADITSTLVACGWDADAAATTARRSLRRADHHRVLYGTLCWSVGLAALGLATGMHQALSGNPDPELTAIAFTLAVILAPLAAFCGWTARRVEAESSHAIWSPTRRMWFATLATCTAIVGLGRLITYVYRVIATMTGAAATPLTPQDQWQVVVSLAVAIPLFVWSLVEWRRSDVVISGLRDRKAS